MSNILLGISYETMFLENANANNTTIETLLKNNVIRKQRLKRELLNHMGNENTSLNNENFDEIFHICQNKKNHDRKCCKLYDKIKEIEKEIENLKREFNISHMPYKKNTKDIVSGESIENSNESEINRDPFNKNETKAITKIAKGVESKMKDEENHSEGNIYQTSQKQENKNINLEKVTKDNFITNFSIQTDQTVSENFFTTTEKGKSIIIQKPDAEIINDENNFVDDKSRKSPTFNGRNNKEVVNENVFTDPEPNFDKHTSTKRSVTLNDWEEDQLWLTTENIKSDLNKMTETEKYVHIKKILNELEGQIKDSTTENNGFIEKPHTIDTMKNLDQDEIKINMAEIINKSTSQAAQYFTSPVSYELNKLQNHNENKLISNQSLGSIIWKERIRTNQENSNMSHSSHNFSLQQNRAAEYNQNAQCTLLNMNSKPHYSEQLHYLPSTYGRTSEKVDEKFRSDGTEARVMYPIRLQSVGSAAASKGFDNPFQMGPMETSKASQQLTVNSLMPMCFYGMPNQYQNTMAFRIPGKIDFIFIGLQITNAI